jgi:hypothetical protein
MILHHMTILLIVTAAHSIMMVLMVVVEGRRGWRRKNQIAVVHVIHGCVHVTTLERGGQVLHQLRLCVAFGISENGNQDWL